MTNTNPETGIRYGIINSNSLDPEVLQELTNCGEDVHYKEASTELWDSVKRACRDCMTDSDSDDIADQAVERLSERWDDDEPVHEFMIDGVKGQTTWLGGALLVWVFHSQWTTQARLCSPCVPNAGNLDSLNPDGYECYDVNPTWRISNDKR